MGTVSRRNVGSVALLVIDNPPVNALSARLRGDLVAAIAAAEADPAVRAIVLSAAGRTFVAGADITEFGKPPIPPSLPDVLVRIEACAKPVVAALNGAALGGGFELALAAHARVAAPGATVGLPEIKLGLLPGAGGTQRLPRLIGAAKAFSIMLSGAPVEAGKAAALGLVDAVADGDLIEAAVALALEIADRGEPRRLSAVVRAPDAGDRAAFEAAAREALAKSPDAPNVAALVEAVRAALDLPFAEGLALERARFTALLRDPRSKAARHLFFAEREAARVPGVGRDDRPRTIARAAVIGAGTMGGGIAMCFAQAGIPVTVIETKREALDAGLARVRANWETSVKRGSLDPATLEARLALLSGEIGLEAAAEADVIVEAAFEEIGVKEEIFRALDRIAKPGAILATNTSYLDVDVIAGFTSRPADVIGLHFFSPANVMRLLEIVRAAKTAPDVIATALDLGRRLAKLPVVVGVCHGFVGNRILAKRSAAAERLLLAGALPHEIDDAVTGFGFRMGPFAMADLAGLDIGWRTRKATGGRAPVADALCEQGRFGQKTGRGFYLYPAGARKGERDPEVEALILGLSEAHGITRRAFSPREIVARLFYPMVNEGAKILEEGIAARSSDIDLVWINGYGWPAATGGPMHWADRVGLSTIVAALDEMADESGDESPRPAALLRRLADEGATFAGPAAPDAPLWRRHFPSACDWDAPLEIGTLPELLAKGVALGGDRPAIDFRGRTLSYRELATRVERLASGLARAGVGPGDAVALLLPNTPWHPIVFFAVTRLGARIVALSPLDARREVAHKLHATGAKWLVTTNLPGLLPQALDQRADGAVPRVLVADDAVWGEGETAPLPMPEGEGIADLATFFDDAPLVVPPPKADDIAVLQFTGGTTGTPRAAMLTHGNLTAAVAMYRLWQDGERPLVPGEERVVAVLPLFHIYALTTVLLRHLRDGNTLLLRQRFDVETLVADIEKGRATQFSGVPTMWVSLLARPGVETVDFSSLKSCVSGGAPLPFDVQARIEKLVGTRLNNGWGMTETAPAGSRVPASVPRRPGLIGIPLPGLAMRIVGLDDPSRAVEPGEVGEIAIRGPNVFAGYLGDPAGTAAAFRDGWFLTGDIGSMDARGLFEIVDRRKNMIISSGFNVYPAAIENAIHEHPSVEEVIVIGVADPYRGQSAKAFVKLRRGAPAPSLDELVAFLADRLGRHEMPRDLEIREALPKSATGKLLARELIAEEAARAAPAAAGTEAL